MIAKFVKSYICLVDSTANQGQVDLYIKLIRDSLNLNCEDFHDVETVKSASTSDLHKSGATQTETKIRSLANSHKSNILINLYLFLML